MSLVFSLSPLGHKNKCVQIWCKSVVANVYWLTMWPPTFTQFIYPIFSTENWRLALYKRKFYFSCFVKQLCWICNTMLSWRTLGLFQVERAFAKKRFQNFRHIGVPRQNKTTTRLPCWWPKPVFCSNTIASRCWPREWKGRIPYCENM